MTYIVNTTNVDNNGIFNLEVFFELSADLLCVAGYDGYFRRINPIVSKTLGYTNEELFAVPIHTFIHPDDKLITAENRKNLTRNEPLLNFENRYVTKSGEIVWLSWTSMPLDTEQLVFAIAKNITHKKKTEEDRNNLLANLTQVNNNLKQLNYTTSHNLRSPVNNLLSVFNILDTTKIQDKETLEFIEVLKLATENLKNTLNGYVEDLSQKDILTIHTEELDFNDCFNDVIHSLRSLINDSGASIHADFSILPTINFNKSYLESIFLNLITNAIKYRKIGSVPVIKIQTIIENGNRQLIFSDEGLGFDMERVKDKIFGFNQKFHNNIDSKGIGLYLVYNHVTNLGGQIIVESDMDEGAKFIITFKE
ncbi:PAS domain-containing sensor histidine kinase [Pedobacter metabolipauper]|uniref:histidine kinase n=1 Tax=Pedobacter metabolipauper TaxID=425513 RepID=A0A4R6T0B9_9SPHI|nr:PAS domain-containing sensor histidine kinase [Pedobacter metabolipauper]TDQ11008.1 PAS domain S-box-containing protein [Pedobacter metabolipauper]